jgi:hypothetical protein
MEIESRPNIPQFHYSIIPIAERSGVKFCLSQNGSPALAKPPLADGHRATYSKSERTALTTSLDVLTQIIL